MNKQQKNKVKAGIILFVVDFIFTVITISLLGFTFEFTNTSVGIIAVVNLVAIWILSFFKLIEDGK